MLRHYSLYAPEKAAKHNADDPGSVSCTGIAKPGSQVIGRPSYQGYHKGPCQSNGDETFAKYVDEACKKEKGKGRFYVPEPGVGQIPVYPCLTHKDESALIGVNVIAEKEREPKQKGCQQQNWKNPFPGRGLPQSRQNGF